MDKTLILSERHCSVLELNEVVIGLSGKGWRWGGSGSCLALMRKFYVNMVLLTFFFGGGTESNT